MPGKRPRRNSAGQSPASSIKMVHEHSPTEGSHQAGCIALRVSKTGIAEVLLGQPRWSRDGFQSFVHVLTGKTDIPNDVKLERMLASCTLTERALLTSGVETLWQNYLVPASWKDLPTGRCMDDVRCRYAHIDARLGLLERRPPSQGLRSNNHVLPSGKVRQGQTVVDSAVCNFSEETGVPQCHINALRDMAGNALTIRVDGHALVLARLDGQWESMQCWAVEGSTTMTDAQWVPLHECQKNDLYLTQKMMAAMLAVTTDLLGSAVTAREACRCAPRRSGPVCRFFSDMCPSCHEILVLQVSVNEIGNLW